MKSSVKKVLSIAAIAGVMACSTPAVHAGFFGNLWNVVKKGVSNKLEEHKGKIHEFLQTKIHPYAEKVIPGSGEILSKLASDTLLKVGNKVLSQNELHQFVQTGLGEKAALTMVSDDDDPLPVVMNVACSDNFSAATLVNDGLSAACHVAEENGTIDAQTIHRDPDIKAVRTKIRAHHVKKVAKVRRTAAGNPADESAASNFAHLVEGGALKPEEVAVGCKGILAILETSQKPGAAAQKALVKAACSKFGH